MIEKLVGQVVNKRVRNWVEQRETHHIEIEFYGFRLRLYPSYELRV